MDKMDIKILFKIECMVMLIFMEDIKLKENVLKSV